MSDDQNTTDTATTADDPSSLADSPSAGERSAGDELDAARGGSAADDESAIQTGSAADDEPADRKARKTREGVVTSASMDKTIVVTVTDRVRHPKYNKFVLRTKKLYTHDDANDAGIGDRVRVMETRPLSKNKRWRLVDVLERAR